IEYQGTRERGEDKQRAFRTEELQRLFLGEEIQSFATDPDQAERYWLPLLGLHTGARINELCQINPAEDWITPDGIHCLHITTETEAGEDVTKSINTGTPRIVPIHPKLIEPTRRLAALECRAPDRQNRARCCCLIPINSERRWSRSEEHTSEL